MKCVWFCSWCTLASYLPIFAALNKVSTAFKWWNINWPFCSEFTVSSRIVLRTVKGNTANSFCDISTWLEGWDCCGTKNCNFHFFKFYKICFILEWIRPPDFEWLRNLSDICIAINVSFTQPGLVDFSIKIITYLIACDADLMHNKF